MATFYIPYVVGSSAIAYIGKEIMTYLYTEDKSLDKIKVENKNDFLKNIEDTSNRTSPEFDIIEEEKLPVYGPINKPDNKEIDTNNITDPQKKVSFCLNDTYSVTKSNKQFKPTLSIIEEDNSIELSKQIPINVYKCNQCNNFLPIKCFSKTQKKKLKQKWKCKVCLKLN